MKRMQLPLSKELFSLKRLQNVPLSVKIASNTEAKDHKTINFVNFFPHF
jgi:hypothetical protein